MGLTVDERASVFSALADPTRLRIVELLASEEELNGSQVARKLGISLALLSHHWKILGACGVVLREKRGQSLYCQLNHRALEDAFEYVWGQRRIQSALAAKQVSQ